MERDRIKILTFLALSITIIFYFPPEIKAEYKKSTQEKGFRIQLNLDELAAVNFILSGTGPDVQIQGETGALENNLFSGKNHNLDGTFGEGEKPAIRLNSSKNILNIDEVTLEGTPVIEENSNYELNPAVLGAILRKNADLLIQEDSTLQNTTIGSPRDYKIVYLDDAELILSHNFKGYGILYIEDKTHTQPILKMLGNAEWYGLIIVNNQLTPGKDSKIFLEGSSALNLEDFALLGIESLRAGNGLTVNSGIIGAYLEGGNATLGDNIYLGNGIIADLINLGNNATIRGNIYYTSQFTYRNDLVHTGEIITPAPLEFADLPFFPEFNPGTQNINLGNNTSYILTPGNYNNISLGNNVILYLAGGIYNINKITAGNNCIIKYQNPCEIRIKEKIEFGNTPSIEPDSENLDADNCIFYIEGANYPYFEEVFYYEDGFITGNQPKIYCNIYAPNSNVRIGNYGNYRGAIIAKKITSGNTLSTSIELKSAFLSPPRFVQIYGSFICIGNKFHIPDSGKNSKVLYSQEALEKVNQLLNNLPLTWLNWKEME